MEDQLKDFQRQLQVVVYEIKSKFNEISSIARARIIYKGQNRNATYITEEFAEKLLATVPYTPVKGIWDEAKGIFLTMVKVAHKVGFTELYWLSLILRGKTLQIRMASRVLMLVLMFLCILKSIPKQNILQENHCLWSCFQRLSKANGKIGMAHKFLCFLKLPLRAFRHQVMMQSLALRVRPSSNFSTKCRNSTVKYSNII